MAEAGDETEDEGGRFIVEKLFGEIQVAVSIKRIIRGLYGFFEMASFRGTLVGA